MRNGAQAFFFYITDPVGFFPYKSLDHLVFVELECFYVDFSAMEPKSPSKHKFSIMGFTQYKRVIRISTVVLVLVLLFVGAHFAFKPGEGVSVFKGSYYTVVVDCGSTRT